MVLVLLGTNLSMALVLLRTSLVWSIHCKCPPPSSSSSRLINNVRNVDLILTDIVLSFLASVQVVADLPLIENFMERKNFDESA